MFCLAAYAVSVECRQNDMSITLPKSLLLGMNREHLTVRDVDCIATESETHYTLKTALTGCGTTAIHRKGAVVYSNTVLEIPVADDAIITRVRGSRYPSIVTTRTRVMRQLLVSNLIPGS